MCGLGQMGKRKGVYLTIPISSNSAILKEYIFPYLEHPEVNYTHTSDVTDSYNCIAWAAEDTKNFWNPVPDLPGYYWPEGIPREETVEAWTLAFQTIGYEPCETSDFEQGFKKIAIYSKNDTATHMARQLPDGSWTSKIGVFEDIKHYALASLRGPSYGNAVAFMKKVI